MATAKQIADLVDAAEIAESVLREMHQNDEAAGVASALYPFLFPEHECPENTHLGCGECGGKPVCECAPGDCPEDRKGN